MHNKPHTQETKDKISKKLKGRKLSIETCKKMSIANKGRIVTWGNKISETKLKNGTTKGKNSSNYKDGRTLKEGLK